MTKAATSARGTMKTLHSWASLAVNRCRHPCDDALPAKQSLELIWIYATALAFSAVLITAMYAFRYVNTNTKVII